MNQLMSTRLPKYDRFDLSSLDGLSKHCDMFIFDNYIIEKKKNPKLIFVNAYKGNIGIPFFIDIVLPRLNNKFNLIVAGDDYTFPYGKGDSRKNLYKDCQDKIFKILLKNEFLNKIFVENCDIDDPRFVPIPLGMLGTKNIYYKKYLEFYPKNLNHKKILLFVCHRIHNKEKQFSERMVVNNLIQHWRKFTYYREQLEQSTFINTLLHSHFTLCVQGGGYDTCPRLWEALLVGTIPIVKSHFTMNKIYREFPVIVIVKDWNEINEEKLYKWLEERKEFILDPRKRKFILDKLKLKYWYQKMLLL